LKRDFAEVLDKLNRYGFLFYPREGGAQREGSIFPEEGDNADRKVFPGLRRQP
jgi:hypothetical protein